jgi:hypothetical protein
LPDAAGLQARLEGDVGGVLGVAQRGEGEQGVDGGQPGSIAGRILRPRATGASC